MISIPTRDSKGRFSGNRYPEIEAQIAADNERAQKIVKVCDSLGFKAEDLGVKQLESGNWRIDYQAMIMLSGIATGLTLGLGKSREEGYDLLLQVSEALGIKRNVDKRFPFGVRVTYHTDHRSEHDRVKIEMISSQDPTISSLNAAQNRAEEVLKTGREYYCVKLWEGGIPFSTLYWNGRAVFYRNTLGIISRERAAGVIVDPSGEDWTDPQDQEEAGASTSG